MPNTTIEDAKRALAEKKEKLIKKEKLLKEKERKLRTRKLIHLGSLFEKAELDHFDSMQLFGALLEIKPMLSDDATLTHIAKKGKEAFDQKHKDTHLSPLAVSFENPPPKSLLLRLKQLGFKWNRFRNEWYGTADQQSLAKELEKASPKIEVLNDA